VVGCLGYAYFGKGETLREALQAVAVSSDQDQIHAVAGQFCDDEPALIAISAIDCDLHGSNI
jgi:hypothetical protein